MKYRKKGIKREHHILEGFEELLEELVKLGLVEAVIPGRITTTPKGIGGKHRITYQYDTEAGAKLLLKKGSTVQEAFAITKKREELKNYLEKRYKKLSKNTKS